MYLAWQTIIGEAFRQAWDQREMIECAMKVQDLLIQRGLQVTDLFEVFRDFDMDGSGQLDWMEFKAALIKLRIHLPLAKV